MHACSYSDTVISEKSKKTEIFIQPYKKQRSKDVKHFTTPSISEIKSYQDYQGHLQKHKPQEMITQYTLVTNPLHDL